MVSIDALSWSRIGRVYRADKAGTWMNSHAFVPTPLVVDERTIRVFVAFLDPESRGRVGYVDVDAEDPTKILRVSEQPVLDLGPPGAFDDSGVTPVQVLRIGEEIWLYYNGWQRSVGVPYFILGGLAISRDGGESFERVQNVPVLERTNQNYLVRSTPFVMPPDDRHARWRMWLSAGQGQFIRPSGGAWAPIYGISYCESENGIDWSRTDTEVVAPITPDEFGLTRPQIFGSGDDLVMLFSSRSTSRIYQMEWARSTDDGRTWRRTGTVAGFDAPREPWESEMVAFGTCVHTASGWLMFYNGNGYGREGFGVARAPTAS
ncbi:exo-alpha-sialidase [Methylobacterium sp. E-046]|uniref:exo-alpha-sialidase n=1 Tax=Methylobacterium sp. E-046 TaxID=2836576 RepID=UPI001FBA069F|nr:exo-alpha-sialidase [Methylobacterium sp. E-046]MCJ2099400.1 exo-alpha-sialidase [Methylobacterium sp. E-046]